MLRKERVGGHWWYKEWTCRWRAGRKIERGESLTEELNMMWRILGVALKHTRTGHLDPNLC